MKTYQITITDYSYGGRYTGNISGEFANKTEARAAARLYIKQWKLYKATIDAITEVSR